MCCCRIVVVNNVSHSAACEIEGEQYEEEELHQVLSALFLSDPCLFRAQYSFFCLVRLSLGKLLGEIEIVVAGGTQRALGCVVSVQKICAWFVRST